MTETEKFFYKLKGCPDDFPCPLTVSFFNPSLHVGLLVANKGDPIKKVKDHLYNAIIQCSVILGITLDNDKLKGEIYSGPF